jgi:hypothetical protein
VRRAPRVRRSSESGGAPRWCTAVLRKVVERERPLTAGTTPRRELRLALDRLRADLEEPDQQQDDDDQRNDATADVHLPYLRQWNGEVPQSLSIRRRPPLLTVAMVPREAARLMACGAFATAASASGGGEFVRRCAPNERRIYSDRRPPVSPRENESPE